MTDNQYLFKTLINIFLSKSLFTIVLCLFITSSINTYSNTFIVTNTEDSGKGSLREAISFAEANPGPDAIVFEFGKLITDKTIILKSGQLEISTEITIKGDNVTLDGNGTNRIFDILDGSVELSKLIITNGFSDEGGGGGIRIINGKLFIVDCEISNNFSESVGGGISNNGTLNMKSCFIFDNRSNFRGGGVANFSFADLEDTTISSNRSGSGGGIYNSGTATLNKCIISTNVAWDNESNFGEGGGILNRRFFDNADISINDSTISGNFCIKNGGGIANIDSDMEINNSVIINNHSLDGGGYYGNGNFKLMNSSVITNDARNGGGLYFPSGVNKIINSTISGNRANRVGGGIGYIGFTLEITYSTIAFNHASGIDADPNRVGGGIAFDDEGITISNSILGKNTGPNDSPSNVVGFLDHTLHADFTLFDTIEAAVEGSNIIISQDARLQPLDENGGSTPTHALFGDSPAIDAGNVNIGELPLTDQRGQLRVQDGTNDSIFNPIVDLGAVEFDHPNERPQFSDLDNNPTYLEKSSAIVLDNDAKINDVDLDLLNNGNGNYGGSVLSISRSDGANVEDQFSSTGKVKSLVEGQPLIVDSITIGTVITNSNGFLKLSFNQNAKTALVQSTLQQITYKFIGEISSLATLQLDFVFDDGNTGLQGTGRPGIAKETIEITLEDNPPIASNQTISTLINTPINIQLNASGPLISNITFSINTPPLNGSLFNLNEDTGLLTYSPNQNFVGNDTFTFQANAGEDQSVGTIIIEVQSDINATSTPTLTPTNTAVIPPTFTPTNTAIINPTNTFTPTNTAVIPSTFTPTNTAIIATNTPIQVTPTATPTFTQAPTSTPTVTPTTIATFNSGQIEDNQVKVFDDLFSDLPLTGTTDFDAFNNRQLAIRWAFSGDQLIFDWHVYVKRNDGGFFFLDRTDDGESRSYVWENPDINTQYQFRVWGLFDDENGNTRLVVLSQKGLMGYNLEGGEVIKLKQITNPNDLPAETAIVVDDLFSSEDLSGQTDTDTPLDQAIALKFNPGEGEFTNVHVQISVNGSDFAFLGQTGAENLNFFRFDNNGTFALANDFKEGPQDGNTYAFRVFAFRSTGGLVRMDTGAVDYSLDTTTGSPTDASVEVFDDTSSNQPLISETDFDDLNDRKLDIRWTFDGNEPITDWHAYVKRNDGGFFFLGRTGNGSSRSFLWENPDVNAQYQFRVWGLFQDDQGVNRLVVLSQPQPIGYNLNGGAEIKLKQITNPSDLPAQTAILVDDLFHNTDLSGGTDVDGELDRAIGLKWNPGTEDINNTHIYISTDDGENFEFLGQTGAENLNFFRFDINGTFALSNAFQDGPQNGLTYEFNIISLLNDGGLVILNTGPVQYRLE